MAKVSFTPNLRRHLILDNCEVSGNSVAQILKVLFEQHEKLAGYILDDQGQLRKHMNIFVNDSVISDRKHLTDKVTEHDEVFIVQALSGG